MEWGYIGWRVPYTRSPPPLPLPRKIPLTPYMGGVTLCVRGSCVCVGGGGHLTHKVPPPCKGWEYKVHVHALPQALHGGGTLCVRGGGVPGGVPGKIFKK